MQLVKGGKELLLSGYPAFREVPVDDDVVVFLVRTLFVFDVDGSIFTFFLIFFLISDFDDWDFWCDILVSFLLLSLCHKRLCC
jgi:hypothetical protein